ncbi:MAG TPA: M24 family metallopeptidase [Planctomycetota bacterium]|jgi:antitoxin VapB|nr:M24 family metallopeptidase [Planctomycetota bacterium]
MNEKELRLAEFCKRGGYDGVRLRRRVNIAWLTDGADVHVDASSSTGVGSVIWTPRKKTVLCNNIEERRLHDEEFGKDWSFEVSKWWEASRAAKGKFATDFPDDPFGDLRSPLTEQELTRLRALGRTTVDALEQVMLTIRRGETEHEVAADMIGRLRKQGIMVPVALIASDERIAKYRHPIPTAKTIEKTVMVVACPRQYGLTIAVTRLLHFGKSLPPALRRKHEAVCRIDAAFHAATAPGQRWCDIFKVGQQVYRETGFADEWKLHHQGGPMGYEGRDYLATPSETRRVVENQAIGWNPSITGTKSEDTILSSGEVLTAMKNWPSCGSRPDILCR